MLVRVDGARDTHHLLRHLERLNTRHRAVRYSVGWKTRADWDKHKYAGYGSRTLTLQMRNAGSTTWSAVKSVKTDSKGNVKTTVKPTSPDPTAWSSPATPSAPPSPLAMALLDGHLTVMALAGREFARLKKSSQGSPGLSYRLNYTGYLWALASLRNSPGADAHYRRRREAGDWHAAAQRNLFNRMIGQLHHCLQHHKLFDEHTAFPTQLTAAA
jgi:hypothetical protein